MNPESAPDRLKALDEIEKKITNALNNAALALQELGKERPVEKSLEKHTSTYMKFLEEVETDVLTQINYLTQVATSQQHEGSCYAEQKRVQLLKAAICEIERQVDNISLTAGNSTTPVMQTQRPSGT